MNQSEKYVSKIVNWSFEIGKLLLLLLLGGNSIVIVSIFRVMFSQTQCESAQGIWFNRWWLFSHFKSPKNEANTWCDYVSLVSKDYVLFSCHEFLIIRTQCNERYTIDFATFCVFFGCLSTQSQREIAESVHLGFESLDFSPILSVFFIRFELNRFLNA